MYRFGITPHSAETESKLNPKFKGVNFMFAEVLWSPDKYFDWGLLTILLPDMRVMT